MEIVFGFLAGILTLINPCVLPVLPIALASSLSSHKLGPIALVVGMSLTFTVLGIAIASLGPALGITVESVSKAGAVMMILFGIILLVPALDSRFALATGGLSSSANMGMHNTGNEGLRTQFLAGALLGAVWAPCIGPTIGGAISLASQGQSIGYAATIMLAFSLGISSVMLVLAYGTREVIRSRQERMKVLAAKAKPIMGLIFLTLGVVIFFDYLPRIEGMLLDAMPIWLQDFSVSI